jgi:hypothetical protein
LISLPTVGSRLTRMMSYCCSFISRKFRLQKRHLLANGHRHWRAFA